MENKYQTKKDLSKEKAKLRQKNSRPERTEGGQKRSEPALRESESRLKGILSSMTDLVFAFDRDGRFTFFHSPRFTDLYTPPEDFIGKKHAEVMPDHIHALFEEAFRKNMNGEIAEFEYHLEIENQVRWFVAKLSPLLLNHEFTGSVAVVREITDRKKTEEELRSYRDHLEEVVEKRTTDLKAAQKRLQAEIAEHKKESLEKTKLLRTIETARDAICICDENGKIIYSNHSMNELFGYDSGELIGKYPSILNAGPEPEFVMQRINKALEWQGFWAGEVANKKKDGTEFTSYARISALRGEDNKITNFLSTQHDITESKRIKEEIKRVEERFRGIYHSSKDAIAFASLDGVLLDVNESYCKLTQYTKTELLDGRKYQDLTPKEYHEYESKIVEKILITGKAEEYEKEYIRKDGSRGPILLTTFVVRGEFGRPIGVAAIIKDITERKKMETALRDSEEKYRTLAENSMDGIYIISSEAGFEYVNPALEIILGYKSEELCHKDFNLFDLIHPDDRKLIKKRIEAREKKKALKPIYEFRIITKEGKTIFVEVSTVPMPGSEKRILGILRDITVRKMAETELLDYQSKLQEQMSIIEQKNIALKEIIAQIETEKKAIKDDMEANIRVKVFPILEKLKMANANPKYINVLQNHLESLDSSFGNEITKKKLMLTPREIEICGMIKGGLTSKEISRLLKVSLNTVEKHRENIRRKTGISKKRINLATFLNEF
jgi:PAS domain S-box-containing protein